jgi:tellurite resistance protein TehA-like permease
MIGRIDEEVKHLDLGCFSLVMATGIVSLAAHFLQISSVSWALFALNIAAYGILGALTAVRARRYLPRIMGELTSHAHGPKGFAIVAATCVLGTQGVLLAGSGVAGLLLWLLGLLFWVGLMYLFWAAVIIGETKPALRDGLAGSWLVAVVATESLSVLGAVIAPMFPGSQERLVFLSLSLYLLGGVQYMLIIGLIFYRLLFSPMTPQEFTPSYWINMGAAAITALAGAILIVHDGHRSALRDIVSFLQGFTLLFWATATWWIPLLVLLEVWRHAHQRFPIAYDREQWNMVFPLGMYGTCTWELQKATGLPFLTTLSTTFVCLALAAWLAVFLGLIHRLYIILFAKQFSNPSEVS